MDGQCAMPVTPDQARLLAALAVACRPHGAPRWDEAGVMAAIKRVADRSLADVCLAVIRAADDRTATTPGVLTATGSLHWRERNHDRPTEHQPFEPGGTCDTCGQREDVCRARWADDHPYVSVLAARRAAAARRAERDALLEQGRTLASRRDDLIAAGANPADLAVPLAPPASTVTHHQEDQP